MNTHITLPTGSATLTMTTREIASLVEKEHKHVLRDARQMLAALGLSEKGYVQNWTDPQNGQSYPQLALPRDLTMTLVTGYSIPLRKRVIDRLDELERRINDPMVALNDPATLRDLLLQNAERVLSLESVLATVQPRAEALERLTHADGTFCITDAAKALNQRPKDMFAWLQAKHWIYRRAGNGHWVGYQDKIQSGLLDHRVEEVTRADGSTKITEQVRVTAKGMARLAEMLNGEGK